MVVKERSKIKKKGRVPLLDDDREACPRSEEQHWVNPEAESVWSEPRTELL